jgi:hypothetical protein
MTATAIPTMVVEDVDLRARPGIVAFAADPMECDHVWEPHLCETGRAYCARCGSSARWVNDPRAAEGAAS